MKKSKSETLKQIYISHQNIFNQFSILFLVGLLAFFAWQLENRFFAIFIIIFFFCALFFRKRHYFILIIVPIILFVLFNTLTFEALLLLKSYDLPSIQHPKAKISNLFTPHSGQGVLPSQVLDMISILNENSIETYRLSEKFAGDIVVYQRIVEGAWPIKPDNKSPFTLISPDEIIIYKDCLTIDKKEDVVLVNCH